MALKAKIDWCDSTWNPVTGCFHNCEYCYARKIAERFGGKCAGRWTFELGEPYIIDGKKQPYPFGFAPTFHRYKLDEPQKWKKPRTIFVCSMADLFGKWVPDEWIEEVFKACEAAPQHRYLFLTKNPRRYYELSAKGKLPLQHWYGTSITRVGDPEPFDDCEIHNTFVSYEPMLEPLPRGMYRHLVQQWVIFGAETGNRKGKVIPQKDWVEDIVLYCSQFGGTKFFMKESLRGMADELGNDFRQEFPWESER